MPKLESYLNMEGALGAGHTPSLVCCASNACCPKPHPRHPSEDAESVQPHKGEQDAGHYYDESVVAVGVCEDNQHMVTGDSQGVVRTWALGAILQDLAGGCEDGEIAEDAVPCVAQWRAHRGAIGSFATVADRPDLLLSCGSDFHVSLWTVHGAHVGTFGQVCPLASP